jgi:hypothetical protein
MVPKPALIPITPSGNRFANLAIMDAFHGVEIAQLVASLRARYDREVLCIRFFGSRDDLPDSGGVNSNWLFHEDVLALFDRLFEVDWTEVGRRCENDNVNIGAGHEPLVGVPPHVAVFVSHAHAFAKLVKVGAAAVEAIWEEIGDGSNFNFR